MIDSPTSGELLNDGETIDIARDGVRPDLRRKVQIVFPNPYGSLDPRQKIHDILAERLVLNTRKPRAERQDLAMQMLQKVGMQPEHFGRYPHMFSGGQRQRIAIARADAQPLPLGARRTRVGPRSVCAGPDPQSAR